jgi:putative resolvase
MEKLLRLSQAAKILGVTERTLVNWDAAGTIKTTRTPGNQRRVPESEVNRLLSMKNPQNKVGMIYFDKIAGVIGFTLNTLTLEIFAMRTIKKLLSVTRVSDGCVFIETDSRGEEAFQLNLFGELLGFSQEAVLNDMAGVNFYLEGHKV